MARVTRTRGNKRARRSQQSPARLRALAVLSEMRHGKSLAQAVRLERTTTRTVRRLLGKQLKRTASGRYLPTKADTLRRELNVFGRDGYTPVVVRSSRQAELASQHLIAVSEYLRDGDADVLKPFAREHIGGVELLTDPARLRDFAEAGTVKLDALYRRGGGPEI